MASMLDCKKIQPLLSEFVDGALPADQARAVAEHLRGCAVCEKVAAELQATVRLVALLPTPTLSEGFEDRLAARLADMALTPRPQTLAERLGAWWGRPRVRPVALTSGVALAAIVPLCAFLLKGPAQQAAVAEESAILTQIGQEHLASAASEPLGDMGDPLSGLGEGEL